MLVDKVRVDFQSGKGGRGGVFYSKFKKSPLGGMGGRGGDVYLMGDENLYDLLSLKKAEKYIAGEGEQGKNSNQRGADGKDITIRVPLVTHIYDLEGNFIVTIEKQGQKVKLLTGGKGGFGNAYYNKYENRDLPLEYNGEKGQLLQSFVELNLITDVAFIGFPNAGKSSMLNALVHSNVKVASYPFTTLTPQMGRCGYLKLMDLPGLIEGASTGKGLGTKFTKHIRTAKLIAHFISLESEDVIKDYLAMRQELKKINEEIYNTPEIILLTKADILETEEVNKRIELLKKYNEDVYAVTTYRPTDIEGLKKIFNEKVKELTSNS